MSKGLNKFIGIGRIGADPETRFFQDGGAVTSFSMAISETWKDRQTGERKEKTEWIRVSCRDRGNYKMGQYAGEWLKKGSMVCVEGKVSTRKWQDQSGQDRYTTEILAENFQPLDKRESSGQPQQQQPQQRAQAPQQPAQQPQGQDPGFPDFEDSIPF